MVGNGSDALQQPFIYPSRGLIKNIIFHFVNYRERDDSCTLSTSSNASFLAASLSQASLRIGYPCSQSSIIGYCLPLFPITPFKASEWHLSGYPTSMIGLCQEGKSSPGALWRSACTNLFLILRRACWPLGRFLRSEKPPGDGFGLGRV